MAGVDLVPLIDEGLGNSAYLVDLGDGRALVVDVSRDLRGVHAAASKRGSLSSRRMARNGTCTPPSGSWNAVGRKASA